VDVLVGCGIRRAARRRRSGIVTVTAHCIGRCDWTAEGTWQAADKAAETHTRKTGHPTATVASPPAAERAA
jgi:hypothetical protein